MLEGHRGSAAMLRGLEMEQKFTGTMGDYSWSKLRERGRYADITKNEAELCVLAREGPQLFSFKMCTYAHIRHRTNVSGRTYN